MFRIAIVTLLILLEAFADLEIPVAAIGVVERAEIPAGGDRRLLGEQVAHANADSRAVERPVLDLVLAIDVERRPTFEHHQRRWHARSREDSG
jgi:hypothetical protein